MGNYSVEIVERRVAAFGSNSFGAVADQLLGFGYKANGGGYIEKDESEIIILDFIDSDNKTINYELPFIVGCDLQLTKSIKTTPINDAQVNGKFIGGGEVVESWGNKGWDITISGLMVDLVNHNRPFDLIRAFTNVIRENTIYEVRSSNLFNALNIGRIYITNVSLPTMEGFKDTQPYQITARSYVPAVLDITD